jgi:disulfide bond formation protein DsbB
MLYRLPQTRSHWLELLTVRNVALLISAVSFGSLASAWAFQYMGFEPCELCYAERNPYYFAVLAGLLAAFLAERAPKAAALILGAICVAMVYDAGLSAYHAGVEWHFWAGPDACTGNGPGIQATGSLSKKLLRNSAVRCDVAALRIFGISLAGYLVFLSLGLAGIGGAALCRARQAGPR